MIATVEKGKENSPVGTSEYYDSICLKAGNTPKGDARN
jgi:hypothetical protein